MKSFSLWYPACPKCEKQTKELDWKRASNYWRIPVATITGFFLFPVVSMGWVCPDCRGRFISIAAEQTAKT
jgi:hypothetical protein